MITVRPATERDYPAIAAIQAACPEAAQWPMGDYSNYSMLVAAAAAGVTAFCAWRQTAPDEAELLNLAVSPAKRRQGIATVLLDALRQVAVGDIFLEVSVANQSAMDLYSKHGWEPVAIRAGYYENGKVDGVVMKKAS